MPTTGLRGSGFSVVSPLPFAQAREQKEANAEQLLQKRTDREDRKKEDEKRQKEADRILKEDFDKAKTEAVLLGLGKGRADSMSLGNLKGWVDAQRSIKANKIDLMNQQAEMAKQKESQDKRNRESMDRAEARRVDKIINNPDFDITKPVASMKNNNIGMENMERILNMSEQVKGMEQGGKPTAISVPGKNGSPALNGYMVNGKFVKGPEPIKMLNPEQLDPNSDGVNDYVQNPNSGAIHSFNPGGGQSYKPQQFDPTKDIYSGTDANGNPKKVQEAEFPPQGVSQEQYDKYNKMRNELLDQINEPAPDFGGNLMKAEQYKERQAEKLAQLNQLSSYLKGVRVNNPANGNQNPRPAPAVKINKSDYLDDNNRRTQNWKNTINSPEEKERVLLDLMKAGVPNDVIMQLATTGRHPLDL